MKIIITKRLIKFGGIPLTCFLIVSVVTIPPTLAQGDSGNNGYRYIVKVKEGFTPAEVAQGHNIPIRHVYEHTLSGFATAKIPPIIKDELESDPRVAYLEIDQKVHIIGEALPWGVDRIDAEKVWGGSEDAVDVTGNAGSGVQVAVIDTGIDYTHLDLDGRYLGGYDFVNGDDDPKDDHGHGTHVSGTIAAEDGDGDVIGVAPEVGLYALKALDKRGSGYLSDVVAGIEWAVAGPDGTEGNDDDAEVVSMSLGASSGSSSLKDAVDSALSKGTLPVAAAGNDGDGDCSTDEYSYPAAYDSVIAVGATDRDDSIASFSNSGPYLELVAPGVDIYSTMPTYDVTMTSSGPPWTRYDKNYDKMSGTSMACPHVSGTAALVFAAGATDQDFDGNIADDVRDILDSTAEDLDYSSNCEGNGLVDAEAAVGAVSPTTDIAVTDVNAPDSVVKGDSASVDVTVKNVGNQDVSDNIDVILEDNTDKESIDTKTIIGGLSAGKSTTLTYTWGTTGVSIDNHKLIAFHDYGDDNSSNDSKTTTVEVKESTGGPTIDRFDITEITSPNPHIEFSTDWGISDGDGNLKEINLVLKDSNGNKIDSATESVSGSTASGTTELKDKHAEGEGKSYYITLTVYDEDGNKASETKPAQ